MIYFLVPVFNEEENIPMLAETLSGVLPGKEKFYVIADDCSSDNSVASIKASFPPGSFHVITKPFNAGPGDSFNLGFEWIIRHSVSPEDRIITLEADNTSDLSILEKMYEHSVSGHELVLASVYAEGGGFERTSFIRKLISFVANVSLRLIFDVRVLTLSSFYRIYHVELISKIKARYGTIITENGFICMVEILIKAIRLKARVIEVPTTLLSGRRKGKSKMKIIPTMLNYIGFLTRPKFRKK